MEQIKEEMPELPADKLVVDALKGDKPLTDEQQIYKGYLDHLNRFIHMVDNFPGSKKQLQRVLINLAISPMNQEELHHGYPHEKELFDLGTEVNSSKLFFLMLQGLQSQGKIEVVGDIIPTTKDNTTETVEMEKKDGEVA